MAAATASNGPTPATAPSEQAAPPVWPDPCQQTQPAHGRRCPGALSTPPGGTHTNAVTHAAVLRLLAGKQAAPRWMQFDRLPPELPGEHLDWGDRPRTR